MVLPRLEPRYAPATIKISTPSRGLENRPRRSLRPLAPWRLDIRHRPPAIGQRILVPKRLAPIRQSGVSKPRDDAYRLKSLLLHPSVTYQLVAQLESTDRAACFFCTCKPAGTGDQQLGGCIGRTKIQSSLQLVWNARKVNPKESAV